MKKTIYLTITLTSLSSLLLTACSDEDTLDPDDPGLPALSQPISQSPLLGQAETFVGTWQCTAQNQFPGVPAFETSDEIDITTAAGESWVRWEFRQGTTPEGILASRGADFWGTDGDTQGLVRYRVDNSGGHGSLYSDGFVADGDGFTLTWVGEVYVAAAGGLVPLQHSFTISQADNDAGQFSVFDTVVSLPGPDGALVPAITGHCERR